MIPYPNHRSYVGCRHHQLSSSRGKLLSRPKHQRFPSPRQPSAHVCLIIGREVSLLPVGDAWSPCCRPLAIPIGFVDVFFLFFFLAHARAPSSNYICCSQAGHGPPPPLLHIISTKSHTAVTVLNYGRRSSPHMHALSPPALCSRR